MRFLVNLVTLDPWRKLGAIAFAVVLWWYVNQQIIGEAQYEIPIRQTRTKNWGPDRGILYVYVPPKRTLLNYPKVTIVLRGTNKDLDNLPHQLTGFYDPGGDYEKFPLALDKILWDPPRVADYAEKISPADLVLQLAPIETHSIPLHAGVLDIQGEPPEGFEVDRSGIEFSTTTLEVSGPRYRIEELKQKPKLFFPLHLQKDDTRTQKFSLQIDPDLTKGLALPAEPVKVFIPLREITVTRTFRAKVWRVASGERAESLLRNYIFKQGSQETLVAEVDFIAEIPGRIAQEISEKWLQEKVRFFVDLDSIPPASQTGEPVTTINLEIGNHLYMLDSQDRSRYQAIKLRTADPAKSKITLEKRKRTPTNGD